MNEHEKRANDALIAGLRAQIAALDKVTERLAEVIGDLQLREIELTGQLAEAQAQNRTLNMNWGIAATELAEAQAEISRLKDQTKQESADCTGLGTVAYFFGAADARDTIRALNKRIEELEQEVADREAQYQSTVAFHADMRGEHSAMKKRIEELETVEWIKMPHGGVALLTCPWCYRTQEEGHAVGCPRKK